MAKSINQIRQTNGFIAQSPIIATQWSNPKMAETNAGTGNVGKIIPVFFRSMTPGEKIRLRHEASIQFIPFMSNLFHQINGELVTYFCPDRISTFYKYSNLNNNVAPNGSIVSKKFGITKNGVNSQVSGEDYWKNFITGGETGQPLPDCDEMPKINLKTLKENATPDPLGNDNELVQTLADYFGMKLKDYDENYDNPPNCRLWHAYNTIYNEHLRNPDFTEQRLSDDNSVATAYWESDRFTHARKQQLRGVVPSVPLSDELGRILELTHIFKNGSTTQHPMETNNYTNLQAVTILATGESGINLSEHEGSDTVATASRNVLLENHKLTNVGINLNDLLTNLAIMKYETNNERMRPEYGDQLYYRFGIEQQDTRLNKPEYIGKTNLGIGVETVTQTAPATSEQQNNFQGKITSQGWANGSGIMEYSVKEHGILMTLMIIRPKGVYEGGLKKMWQGDIDRYDFITPELVDIPDIAIEKQELYYTGNKEKDKATWGYEAIYDDARTMENRVCGWLRPSVTGGLTSYTLARALPSNVELNDTFLKCNPEMSRIKQYTGSNVPDFLFFTRTEIQMAQPLPLINNPTQVM